MSTNFYNYFSWPASPRLATIIDTHSTKNCFTSFLLPLKILRNALINSVFVDVVVNDLLLSIIALLSRNAVTLIPGYFGDSTINETNGVNSSRMSLLSSESPDEILQELRNRVALFIIFITKKVRTISSILVFSAFFRPV